MCFRRLKAEAKRLEAGKFDWKYKGERIRRDQFGRGEGLYVTR